MESVRHRFWFMTSVFLKLFYISLSLSLSLSLFFLSFFHLLTNTIILLPILHFSCVTFPVVARDWLKVDRDNSLCYNIYCNNHLLSLIHRPNILSIFNRFGHVQTSQIINNESLITIIYYRQSIIIHYCHIRGSFGRTKTPQIMCRRVVSTHIGFLTT